METSDHPSLSMSEALRDLAQQMRSVARNFPDHAEKTAETIELDPGNVRDFLIFFGDRL